MATDRVKIRIDLIIDDVLRDLEGPLEKAVEQEVSVQNGQLSYSKHALARAFARAVSNRMTWERVPAKYVKSDE